MSDQTDPGGEDATTPPNGEDFEDETPAGDGDGEDTGTEMDLPTALAELEKARRYIRKVNRESADRRHEIAELQEKLDQHTKTGDEASEQLTTLQTQLSEAKQRLAMMQMRDKFDDVVSKAKIAFASLTAQRDAFEFAKPELQKLTEEATDEDYLDIIKEIVESRPYLRVKPKPKDINSANQGITDAIQGIDLEEISREFGIKNR